MGKQSRNKREFRTFKRKLLHAKHADVAAKLASTLPVPGRLLSADLLADDERSRDGEPGDQFSLNSVIHGLRRVAKEKSEWAGIPTPLSGEQLIVEKSYPCAEGFNRAVNNATRRPVERVCRTVDIDETVSLRNTFWSWRWRSDIDIWEQAGKIRWGLHPAVHGFPFVLATLGCSDAWSLETECRALETLRTLVSHRQFRQYLLTGTFIESSKRSNLKYVFRRLRPTVVLTCSRGDEIRVLCALCLHPIAYYARSWAGAMCPTDDVISHLMLMRGDEPMLWKRANQHPAWRPEAGL